MAGCGHEGPGLPRRSPPGRSAAPVLAVATGNITNAALLALFESNFDEIVVALDEADFVEPGPEAMVVHRRRGDGSQS